MGLITAKVFPFNVRIFLSGVGLCLLFGFLSGVLPATRMSKLHIAESLNENRQ
jgi:putative ABC transport system permease protein